MDYLRFKEANRVLGKPHDMTDEECSDLSIFTDGFHCISCWNPTFIDRIKILFTGKIWLWVFAGSTQPPVSITTTYPFLKGKNKQERRFTWLRNKCQSLTRFFQ